MALIDIPDGQLGAVVTYLEMTERPKPRPLPASPLRLERWRAHDPEKYRKLIRRVCCRLLWFSRFTMSF